MSVFVCAYEIVYTYTFWPQRPEESVRFLGNKITGKSEKLPCVMGIEPVSCGTGKHFNHRDIFPAHPVDFFVR